MLGPKRCLWERGLFGMSVVIKNLRGELTMNNATGFKVLRPELYARIRAAFGTGRLRRSGACAEVASSQVTPEASQAPDRRAGLTRGSSLSVPRVGRWCPNPHPWSIDWRRNRASRCRRPRGAGRP